MGRRHMIWFTADLHLGHERGDVGLGLKAHEIRAVHSRIRCEHVHLVLGNHDSVSNRPPICGALGGTSRL